MLFCAALEVLTYSPEQTLDEVREHVEKCLSANATVGSTKSVYLHSICVTERPDELHISKFCGCSLHPIYGFADGVEFSAIQIKRAVRRMDGALRVDNIFTNAQRS